MEFRRPKPQQIGRSSKPSTACKKHPKHQQNPGVCSICLNEKLSQLSTASRSTNCRRGVPASSSLSSLSSQYSSNASSCSSPVRPETRSGPLIMMRAAGRVTLTKTRSMAAVRRKREGEREKKKSSFWSKLLRSRGKHWFNRQI